MNGEFYTNVFRHRNKLLYRGYDQNGNPVKKEVKFKPTLYVQGGDGRTKSIFGDNVVPQQMESMSEARNFIKQYEDIDNYHIFGNTDYIAQYIQEKWPGEVPYDESLIKIADIDIEVAADEGFPRPEEALWPVDLITLKHNQMDQYFVLSLYEWSPDKTEIDIDPSNVVHHQFDCEEDLLEAFLNIWNMKNFMPDVVTGWNIQGFDIIYLYNRISRLLSEKKAKLMSPWGIADKRQMSTPWGKEYEIVDLAGIAQVDMLKVIQKFGHKYLPIENFKLDTVAKKVLDASKLDFGEYKTLKEMRQRNPQKYTDYNIIDVVRVEQIIDKTKLMSLVFTMAYRAGVNFMETFGTTRIWDTIIYRDLLQRNTVVQPMKKSPSVKYEGAYVKDIAPSSFDYVASFDIASLYPNIMIEWNMSPETLIDGMVDVNVDLCLDENFDVPATEGYAVAANGARFRKDKQGCVPRILEQYYSDRKAIQKQLGVLKQQREDMKNRGEDTSALGAEVDRLFNEQMSIKLLINSCYGAIGNAYFRHYDLRIAEGITLTGQLIIQWAQLYINKVMNSVLETEGVDYVCYVDTDSNYIDMSKIIEKFKPDDPIAFMDSVCTEGIAPALEKAFDVLGYRHRTYKPRISMGREVLADRAIWTSKKRYAMRVHDNEGVRYKEPELKIMGLEAVKTTVPETVRGWMKEYIKMVLDGRKDDATDFIAEKRKEFVMLNADEIGMPRGISELSKYTVKDGEPFKKGTPYHARGCLVYNRELHHFGLDKTYPIVYDGDKIKIMYMTLPNPTQSNVIAFPDELPTELNLDQYIDYETQFDKCFVSPMEALNEAVGWTSTDQTSLSDFFG